MKQDEHMDDWMRDHLDDHASVLPEGGWSGLQDGRKKKKRKPFLFWWLTGFASAAAVLSLIWIIFNTDAPVNEHQAEATKTQQEVLPSNALDVPAMRDENGNQLLNSSGEADRSLTSTPAKQKSPTVYSEEKSPETPLSRESQRKPFQQEMWISPKTVALRELNHLPVVELAVVKPDHAQQDDQNLPNPKRESIFTWHGAINYGLGPLNARENNTVSAAVSPGNQHSKGSEYSRIIDKSSFRLHRLGISFGAGLKRGPWAWSSGLRLSRHWVVSQLAPVEVENIGSGSGNPGNYNSISSQDVQQEISGDPARFWSISTPTQVSYYPWKKAYFTASAEPLVNFGTKGRWVIPEDFDPHTLESLRSELGMPLWNLGLGTGFGYAISPAIHVQYEAQFWLRRQFQVEGFDYRSTAHQVKLLIKIPGQ